MFVHKAFTVITNLFGLNFYEQKVSLRFVLFLNIIVLNLHAIINIYYAMISSNPKLKVIYLVIDFIQLIWPLIYKNFIFFWSMYRKKFDKAFDEKTRKTFEPSQIKKNQQKFFMFIVITFSVLLIKIVIQPTRNDFVYNFSYLFLLTVNTTSDFIFVYHILCLKDHVKYIRQSNCDIREETLKVIEIKQLIISRYSMTLMLVIAHDFLLITISLYWLFARIVFGYLKTLAGEIFFCIYFPKISDKNFIISYQFFNPQILDRSFTLFSPVFICLPYFFHTKA